MLAANRTALVTGAAGGIGAASARYLAARGHRVFLLDRDAERVSARAREIPEATALTGDLTDADLPNEVSRRIESDGGRLDVVVHAAGVMLEAEGSALDGETLSRTLDVNLSSSVRLSLSLLPLLRRSPSPRIVTVGSIQADRAGASSIAYAASKGGLHAATRALAVELAADGILVNAVAPGFIDTPMSVLADGRTEFETEWFQRIYVEHARLPLRRPGTADEVAGAVGYLASAENTYVTGAVLAVDGGLGAAL